MTPVPDETRPDDDAVLAQAAQWLARLRGGPLTGREAAALKRWLAEDGEHAAALDLMLDTWDHAAPLAASPIVRSELALATRRPSRRKPEPFLRRWAPLYAGAIAGLAALGVFAAGRTTSRVYRAPVGQIASVTLADRSVVWLDADTVIETRFSGLRRQVALRRGAAEFKVAHEAWRPFVVATDTARVRATGTDFSVRREGALTRVVLVQGAVVVSRGDGVSPLELHAGEATTVSGAGPSAPVKADADAELAWRNGRLIFFRKPLAAVVEDFARYSDIHVRFADEAAKRILVSGTFEAKDFRSFLTDIASLYGIRFSTDDKGGTVIRSGR